MIKIEIDLNNMQEIRYDHDEDQVIVKYTSSIDRSKPPVEIDVDDEEEAHDIINEISAARQDYLEDEEKDTFELDIE